MTSIPFHFQIYMMTSSNGNIFPVTSPLSGEFTGPGDFPTQRPVTRSLEFFFIYARINDWVNNLGSGDLKRHRGHYNVNVMLFTLKILELVLLIVFGFHATSFGAWVTETPFIYPSITDIYIYIYIHIYIHITVWSNRICEHRFAMVTQHKYECEKSDKCNREKLLLPDYEICKWLDFGTCFGTRFICKYLIFH